jgi:low temperature requirement protein LtrA
VNYIFNKINHFKPTLPTFFMVKINPRGLTALIMTSLYGGYNKHGTKKANSLVNHSEKPPTFAIKFLYFGALALIATTTFYIAYKTITTPLSLADPRSRKHSQTNQYQTNYSVLDQVER